MLRARYWDWALNGVAVRESGGGKGENGKGRVQYVKMGLRTAYQ
jgi:hypothetical protein